jgi:hypothetical protein
VDGCILMEVGRTMGMCGEWSRFKRVYHLRPASVNGDERTSESALGKREVP